MDLICGDIIMLFLELTFLLFDLLIIFSAIKGNIILFIFSCLIIVFPLTYIIYLIISKNFSIKKNIKELCIVIMMILLMIIGVLFLKTKSLLLSDNYYLGSIFSIAYRALGIFLMFFSLAFNFLPIRNKE